MAANGWGRRVEFSGRNGEGPLHSLRWRFLRAPANTPARCASLSDAQGTPPMIASFFYYFL
jgi:hypothetical protein